MTAREEKAQQLFREGRNCAQAVLTAYKDWMGLDEQTALTVSMGFGGGIGRSRSVCGAFSAMVMLAPCLAKAQNLDEDERKQVYAKVQEMKKAFEEANGSIICADILKKPQQAEDPQPEDRTEAYYRQRPCARVIAHACRILEELYE